MMGWNEAVEAMDAGACENGVGHSTEDCWRHREIVKAALTALLEATQSEPCATCGGTGHWTATRSEVAAGAPPPPAPFNVCAPCDGSGRVPGTPLVLLAPRQVGWFDANGQMAPSRGNVKWPGAEPLYAAQTEEKQT